MAARSGFLVPISLFHRRTAQAGEHNHQNQTRQSRTSVAVTPWSSAATMLINDGGASALKWWLCLTVAAFGGHVYQHRRRQNEHGIPHAFRSVPVWFW